MSVAVGGGPGGAFTCLSTHFVGVLAMRVLPPKPTGMSFRIFITFTPVGNFCVANSEDPRHLEGL